MKPSYRAPLQAGKPATIRWRGKRCTLAEAGALAVQEQMLGNLAAAAEIYRLMLERLPNSAELHNNYGVMLLQLNRLPEALAACNRAVKLKLDYANAYFNRGIILKKLNRLEEALDSYDQALARNPNHADACHNRSIVLQELRRYDEALEGYQKTLAIQPDHAAACNNLGTALMSQGRATDAERMFLKARELKPNFADPWFNLANLRKYDRADHADAAGIRALLDRPGLSDDDREQLNFALGKILDDCGRHDEAFSCYETANRLRNARVAYNAGAVAKTTDDVIAVFNTDFLAQPFASASDSSAPLFIVGMPRSGTTLLANMLSNHPAVALAGELPMLSHLASLLPQWNDDGVAYPQAALRISPAVTARLVQEYEARLRRDAGPDAPIVIDKNPLNFLHVGFISKLFPRARILHCVRHPLDTALSNYFQRFPLQLDYAFNLQNIAHFYREYARLTHHWRSIPALNWMEIKYEDMVSNTRQTARQALDFLGLEWEERCAAPHTNSSPVETASQWQVRQPIYRHSLERWRHYEKQLAPFREFILAGDKA